MANTSFKTVKIYFKDFFHLFYATVCVLRIGLYLQLVPLYHISFTLYFL